MMYLEENRCRRRRSSLQAAGILVEDEGQGRTSGFLKI
jgi:hypothetical protein